MKEIILGLWLGIQAGIDYKYKQIPLWLCVFGGVIGIGFCVVEGRGIAGLVISCLPGLVALGFAWITKEMMGYGDGIVLLVMGIYLPISHLISISVQAFFIAGIVALVLLVLFQKKGTYRIPFIPFLGVAYGWDLLMRLGER